MRRVRGMGVLRQHNPALGVVAYGEVHEVFTDAHRDGRALGAVRDGVRGIGRDSLGVSGCDSRRPDKGRNSGG